MEFIEYLGREETISAVGFIAGFFNTTTKNITTEPLTTIFLGSIDGLIYGGCAVLVSKLVPREFRAMVSISLAISVAYYKAHDIKNDENIKQCKNCSTKK